MQKIVKNINILQALRPIYTSKARYKGLKGGRGSGKSWGAVDYFLLKALGNKNINIVCLRQTQKSIKHSSKKLIQDRIEALGISNYFEVLLTEIRIKKGKGVIIFQGLQDHTADSIKSLEGFDLAFVEEAQTITEFSLDLLTPTIRKDGSELLFAWNPRYQTDAVEQMFDTKSNSITVHMNYLENKFCTISTREEAEELKELNLQKYNHIYLGAFVTGDELSIIKEEWIRSSIKAFKQIDYVPKGVKRIGFDVADGKDDNGEEIKNDTNAIVEIHGSLLTSVEEWVAGKDEIFTSSKRVHQKAIDRKINCVNYDNIGVGAGVGSNLKQLNAKYDYQAFTASNSPQNKDSEYKPNKLNKDMFKNIKAQAWQSIADRFINTHNYVTRGESFDMSDMIFIDDRTDNVEKLIMELSSPREKKDGAGRMLVESKRDLKKRGVSSPNLADAFVMAFFHVEEKIKTTGNQGFNSQSFF